MTAQDNLNNYITKLNNTFSKLTTDYNYISSNITKLLNVDIIPYGYLTDLDISMNDLLINIQSILFIIENAIENEKAKENESDEKDEKDDNYIKEQIINNDEQYEKQKKTEILVDNTMKKMLPVFLLCLMMYDNESILNSKSFGGISKNPDNILNGLPNLNIVPDLNYDVYIPGLD
jgi:hypothetical protein